MARLVLLNGAPGAGKSTLARLLVERWPLALALNVDDLKHSLGQWQQDLTGSAVQARALAIAVIREQLASGHDVVLGQYLPRIDFIEELASDAGDLGASFHELVLVLDARQLAARLAERVGNPSRPEHEINNRLVVPADAPKLVASIDTVLRARRRAERGSGPSPCPKSSAARPSNASRPQASPIGSTSN